MSKEERKGFAFKNLPDDEARQKKIYFHFASKEERKDFAKQKPNPLASAIKIKKAFRSFFIFICERMRTVGWIIK